ncbi:hypothetical protein [Segetibacter sp.]|jgi:hypothetical protein|uniref:hypothetical protein n=1 Tax=Segetibacter sp. TaxID=2231182 RepID=UPI002603454D|nr:hypothetical protein [Segetibacter sp.]MCW3081034.1 hypothetical protein [Segetibacter sp.]
MTVKQPVAGAGYEKSSEVSILLFSFITAFAAGIIIISTLFFTVKKIESKLSAAKDIPYSKK